jgi:hypothetical protein
MKALTDSHTEPICRPTPVPLTLTLFDYFSCHFFYGSLQKVESLESDHRFEINLHDEKEDAYLTRQLLAKARHLQLPVPHQYNDDKTESDHWYEGRLSSRWYLTRRGIASLREEIRRELKARQETRAQWFVWLSALTGLVGTITGLVALLIHKSP